MAKILIVDADAQARLSVAQALVRKAEDPAGTAEKTLAAVPSAIPDVIVIDSQMPEIPRKDLIEAIKAKCQNTEFIAITSLPDTPGEAETVRLQPADSAYPYKLPENGLSIDQVEKSFILQALEISGNNKTRAAKLLGISRRAMYSKMKTHRIMVADAGKSG